MAAQARPFFPSRQTALVIGAALSVAGALVLYDACERRGASRPFALHFLP